MERWDDLAEYRRDAKRLFYRSNVALYEYFDLVLWHKMYAVVYKGHIIFADDEYSHITIQHDAVETFIDCAKEINEKYKW